MQWRCDWGLMGVLSSVPQDLFQTVLNMSTIINQIICQEKFRISKGEAIN
jgi:hypothetical protein